MYLVQNVSIRLVDIMLEDFDEEDETEGWPFRELLGCLVISCPDISNAVRKVARYSSTSKAFHHWEKALGVSRTLMVLLDTTSKI